MQPGSHRTLLQYCCSCAFPLGPYIKLHGCAKRSTRQCTHLQRMTPLPETHLSLCGVEALEQLRGSGGGCGSSSSGGGRTQVRAVLLLLLPHLVKRAARCLLLPMEASVRSFLLLLLLLVVLLPLKAVVSMLGTLQLRGSVLLCWPCSLAGLLRVADGGRTLLPARVMLLPLILVTAARGGRGRTMAPATRPRWARGTLLAVRGGLVRPGWRRALLPHALLVVVRGAGGHSRTGCLKSAALLLSTRSLRRTACRHTRAGAAPIRRNCSTPSPSAATNSTAAVDAADSKRVHHECCRPRCPQPRSPRSRSSRPRSKMTTARDNGTPTASTLFATSDPTPSAVRLG